MNSKRKYPIGIDSFEEIITGNYIYVDKTDMIYELVKTGKVYFIRRPAKFGKSVLISTLKAYFEGKKELFKGLAIDKLETEWAQYTVLHLQMGKANCQSTANFDKMLDDQLRKWEELYGTHEVEVGFSLRFEGIIRRAYQKTGRRAAVLIDDYDNPLLDVFENEEQITKYYNELHGLYSVLKAADEYLEFVFVTGSTTCIYTGMNQLNHLTTHYQYEALCGITEDELLNNFGDDIKELSEALNISTEETRLRLKKKYGGHHFCPTKLEIYNPFSLFNAFKTKELANYWYKNATPPFVFKFLQRAKFCHTNMDDTLTTDSAMFLFRSTDKDPISIAFQGGYLTIVGYNDELIILGFPNEEVREDFYEQLHLHFFQKMPNSRLVVPKLWQDLQRGDIEAFIQHFHSLIAGIDVSLFKFDMLEQDYEFFIRLILLLMDLGPRIETHRMYRSMDAEIFTPTHIYMFDFAFDQTTAKALDNLKYERLVERYKSDGRKIVQIGVKFSRELWNLDGWEMQ